MPLVLQLVTDGHDNLVNVDPGHCALGHPANLSGVYTGDSKSDMNVHWKGLSPWFLRATNTNNKMHKLPQRLLVATIAHQVPQGDRAYSA